MRQASQMLGSGSRTETSIASIRDGTRSIRNLISPVIDALTVIALLLYGITMPKITVKKKTIRFPVVGRVRFVTGVKLGTTRPFSGIVTQIRGVRDNLWNVRDALTTVTAVLTDLRRELPTISTSLVGNADETEAAADDMILSGKALKHAGASMGGV